MTDRELMQMALDALEKISMGGDPRWANDVTPALRARLAQPEPLPAKSKGALSHEENKQHNKKILDKFYEENAHLYTAPPQRAEHITDGSPCWCEPELDYKDPDTGAEVWIHKEPQ